MESLIFVDIVVVSTFLHQLTVLKIIFKYKLLR